MNHKDLTWRSQKLEHIKALKSKSPAQKLILDLSSSSSLSPAETRNLDTLLRSEFAREQYEKIEQQATKIAETAAAQKAKTERQIRNNRLFHHGILIEQAGLKTWSDAELLGALLHVARAKDPETQEVEDPERIAAWTKVGAARIAAREAADAERRAKQAQNKEAKKTQEAAPAEGEQQ